MLFAIVLYMKYSTSADLKMFSCVSVNYFHVIKNVNKSLQRNWYCHLWLFCWIFDWLYLSCIHRLWSPEVQCAINWALAATELNTTLASACYCSCNDSTTVDHGLSQVVIWSHRSVEDHARSQVRRLLGELQTLRPNTCQYQLSFSDFGYVPMTRTHKAEISSKR